MPISMTQHVPGMSPADYDEIIANVGDSMRADDGFISHAAEVTPDGITVTELWDSREQWERWYAATVKPHLPPDLPGPAITDLHNTLSR